MAVKPGNTRFFPNAKEKGLGVRKIRREEVSGSVGSDELWERATDALRDALKDLNMDYIVNEGDGAWHRR